MSLTRKSHTVRVLETSCKNKVKNGTPQIPDVFTAVARYKYCNTYRRVRNGNFTNYLDVSTIKLIVYFWHRPPCTALHVGVAPCSIFRIKFIPEKRTVPTQKSKSVQKDTKSSMALHVLCSTLDFSSQLDKIKVQDDARESYYS